MIRFALASDAGFFMAGRDNGDGALIIAVANRKGGTGKTTTAVNLAAGFARRGLSTLLVDLDSQGHAGLGLGLAAAEGEANIHRIFTQGPDAIEAAITAPGRPRPLARCRHRRPTQSPSATAPVDLLSRALSGDAIRRRYDVIVIDTSPSLDPLMINALAAAHAVLILSRRIRSPSKACGSSRWSFSMSG